MSLQKLNERHEVCSAQSFSLKNYDTSQWKGEKSNARQKFVKYLHAFNVMHRIERKTLARKEEIEKAQLLLSESLACSHIHTHLQTSAWFRFRKNILIVSTERACLSLSAHTHVYTVSGGLHRRRETHSFQFCFQYERKKIQQKVFFIKPDSLSIDRIHS
jgi:hypothetical protein